MMRWRRLNITTPLLLALLLTSCAANKDQVQQQGGTPVQHNTQKVQEQGASHDQAVKSHLIKKYSKQSPTAWGEFIPGIHRRLHTNEKVIALTFDACGGPHGSGYDVDIINYLRQMNIPATLFINSRWIDANHETFMTLARTPQFEIENHGYLHKPLSVNGRSAWGIKGTVGVSQIVDEVAMNHRKIERLTGRAPQFFRTGTAFYDDIGVKIVGELGEKAVNYDVLGDAGATFTATQVKHALLSAKPGSIVILHMNQPKGETAEGLKLAIPQLIREGYHFCRLKDFPLQ